MLLRVPLPSLKCSLRVLEHPQRLSRSPFYLSPPNQSAEMICRPLRYPFHQSEAPGISQPPRLPSVIPTKHSICLTMLGQPQTLSGFLFPFLSPSTTPGNLGHPRDFLCPYAQSTALKAWNPTQPSSCFWPLPSQVPVPDVGPSPCHFWRALWPSMRLCPC